MKLGVSYNVFDGEELLEGSIKQIREHTDYISIVYQEVSNFGNQCNPRLLDILNDLVLNNLVDELVKYEPEVNRGGHFNEITKRNIGLELSRKNGCTHHMSMDSDEYYISDEFERVKNVIELNNYDSSYCQMRTYYKSWEYALDPPEDYYVPLIYKIKDVSKFVMMAPSPVLVDPTRRISHISVPVVFRRDEIEMHHGSYIRDDLRTKLVNSSASVNFRGNIDNLVNHYNNWEYPNDVLWGGLPSKYLKVKKVDNLFV